VNQTDGLLLAAMEAPGESLLRVAGGAVLAWAAPKPGAATSEDALLALPLAADAAVLAVADGMGGAPGGAAAAARAVEAMANSVEEGLARGLPLRVAVLNGIEQANESVLEMGTGAATTLAVAEICGGVVRAYNVGDSEVMIIGQRGRLKLRTVSHSPVGFAVQAGLVDQDQAMHHEDRHLVSNFVGSRDMRIEVGSPVRLGPHDTLLVCSDGLVDNLRLSEIAGMVRRGPLDLAIRALAEAAAERMLQGSDRQPGKPDDLSVLGFRLRPGMTVTRRLPLPRQMELSDGSPQ